MDFEKLISDFAERHSVANLAAENNAAALEELVNLSETWRRLLADFRPAAKAAAEEAAEAPSFGTGGFLSV